LEWVDFTGKSGEGNLIFVTSVIIGNIMAYGDNL